MTVVEIWPSTGWYTEVLAPVLRDQGRLYAARYPVSWAQAPDYARRQDQALQKKMVARPDVYGNVIPTEILAPDFVDAAPRGSVDMVLTFRNVHNWAKAGRADAMFSTFFDLLKPGGILGVEEHRARPGTAFDDQVNSGYMTEQYVIDVAEKAGFRFAAGSEINANPRDTKDYPEGVWTLPPTLRLGEQDRERYLAIGESDRMTLKFVKP
ncbi:MAG: methyltransferase [Betaproteobacteria bacterium]